MSVSSSRENWPNIITDPLAIISIHLEGMTDIPGFIAYHHIHPWLHGNAIHIDLDFNFDDIPKNDFASRLGTMLDSFECGHLKE